MARVTGSNAARGMTTVRKAEASDIATSARPGRKRSTEVSDVHPDSLPCPSAGVADTVVLP